MKARAIILASVLLAGCQASKHDGNIQQHAQSLSTASQGDRATTARWMDDGTFIAPDQNLWAYIGGELKMGIPENNRIREQKQKYLKNKSYLHDVTLRAEPYMYWIAGQVKKRNMPMELVLLPIVESAFNPHATSAASAAGIWQIIPSTGRNYGLKQTRNYDARRDVVASTTAALNMMQRLNRMFDGDWLLTVAAYNSGEGRVMKAIKANKAQGKPTDFWSLSLPLETKLYVPKMLALSDLLKNSKQYGIQLPTTDESRALARVKVDSPVSMTQLAEVTGMPLKKLQAFNAGYKGTTVGTGNAKYVMVPQKHAALVRESIAAGEIAAVQPSAQDEASAAMAGSNYEVRSGDTLSSIAARMKVSTRDLQRWNNLRGTSIKPGQKLSIGTSSTSSQLANNSITYRVRKGDSLSSIAKRHGVGVKDVKRWNSDSNALRPGDQLTLYVRGNDRPDT